MRAATFAHMKTFFKSGRYLLWIAAVGMMIGSGVAVSSRSESSDAGGGAVLFVASLLIWLRASKKEKRFIRAQRRNEPAALSVSGSI